jgi:hypothetical protein
MKKLIAALFVTLDGYGFGEGAPARVIGLEETDHR